MTQKTRSTQFGNESLRGGVGIAMVDLAKPATADEGIELSCKFPMFLSQEGRV
jgi:hypothetical protein